MNAKELQRWLKKQGCSFETYPGGSGHITVYLNGKKSTEMARSCRRAWCTRSRSSLA